MERFLHWLETEVASGRTVTEWEASERLTAFRAEIPGYRGNSFENISAYGPGAALPHYSTPRVGSAVLRPCGLYLVDSGGQYLTGTTDITRTVPMGPCTDLEKEDYTLVLKGMIALSAGETVLRLVPPLTVTQEDCEKAIELIDQALAEVTAG